MTRDNNKGCFRFSLLISIAGLVIAFTTEYRISGLVIAGVSFLIIQYFNRVHYFRQGRNPDPQKIHPNENQLVGDLDKLVKLYENGHLSKEEFEAQKKKIIDS